LFCWGDVVSTHVLQFGQREGANIMSAQNIKNHGDVNAYIHETLAKKDAAANKAALIELLTVFGEKVR